MNCNGKLDKSQLLLCKFVFSARHQINKTYSYLSRAFVLGTFHVLFMSNNIIFLKNRTAPLDKYELQSYNRQYDEVQFLPLIAHTHHPIEIRNLLRDHNYLSRLKYIIVTSQRTVECLYESIIPNLTETEKEKLLDINVYTVGPATGEFLRRVGFRNVKGDCMGNGDRLSDFIIEDIGKNYDGEILSLVGAIRRDIIKIKLSQAGFTVREVVTYETCVLKDNLDRFQNTLIDIADKKQCDAASCCWVVVFSPQGANEIIEYLKNNPGIKDKLKLRISCIGPTTNHFLIDNGIQPEVVSPEPSPASLLSAITGFNNATAVQI